MNRTRGTRANNTLWYNASSLILNSVLPSLVHDYANQRYYNRVDGETAFPFTSTRTTNATMFDNQGRLVWAPHNLFRSTVNPTAGTWVFAGTVLPIVTYGEPDPFGGNLATLVDITPAVDCRVAQTAVSTASVPDNSDVTVSFWLKRAPGETETTHVAQYRKKDSTTITVVLPVSDEWNRVSFTFNAGAGGAPVLIWLNIQFGPTIKKYIFFGAQMELGSTVTPYNPNTSFSLEYFGHRIDCDPVTLAARGVLVESVSTNSSPNNMLVGGVAGTPGTAPTGWNISAVTGVTITTSYGNLYGFPYIDVAYSGTNTSGAAAIPTIRFCPTSSVAALNGETWTTSVHIQKVGGTDSITNHTHGIKGRDAGGTLLSGQAVSESLTGGASLRGTRQDISFTFSSASIAFIEHTTQRNLADGASIDITLRIWLPQLEKKAFASSIIPTYGTAATRALDNLSVSTGAWLSATRGTIYAEFMRRYVAPGAGSSVTFAQIYTDAGNRVVLLCGSGTNSQHRFDVFNATFAQVQMQTSVGGAELTSRKMAGMYTLNLFRGAENGASGTEDAVGTIPALTTLSIGCSGTTNQMDGWVKEFRYYSVDDASAVQLQTLTT